MSFGATTPPVELEGDYSTWTLYDLFDEPEGYGTRYGSIDACLNKAKTKIVLMELTWGHVYSYDIATKTLGVTQAVAASGLAVTKYRNSSVLGTYVAQMSGTKDLVIFKDGVLIQTIDTNAAGFDVSTAEMALISWDGQWIIVMGKITATGEYGWMIFRGS